MKHIILSDDNEEQSMVYLASNRKIVTISMIEHEQISDNLIEAKNPMIMPSIAVEMDCRIMLSGKPMA